MTTKRLLQGAAISLAAVWMAVGCGDDGDDGAGTEADRIGVGAECTQDKDCPVVEGEPAMECLEFRGGYCGLSDCAGDADCPSGSACVQHDDGRTYCFRICLDKAECNLNRSAENSANCSSNVGFVDEQNEIRACVPPSSE